MCLKGCEILRSTSKTKLLCAEKPALVIAQHKAAAREEGSPESQDSSQCFQWKSDDGDNNRNDNSGGPAAKTFFAVYKRH